MINRHQVEKYTKTKKSKSVKVVKKGKFWSVKVGKRHI